MGIKRVSKQDMAVALQELSEEAHAQFIRIVETVDLRTQNERTFKMLFVDLTTTRFRFFTRTTFSDAGVRDIANSFRDYPQGIYEVLDLYERMRESWKKKECGAEEKMMNFIIFKARQIKI